MDAPLVESEVAESHPQKRGGPWKLIIIIALLTLIAVWLVPGDAPEKPAAPAGTADRAAPSGSTQPAPSLLGDSALPAPPAADSAGDTPAPLVDDRPGAMARNMIAQMRASGSVDLEQIHAAAETAQNNGDLPDAYLLYFFAAREGHVPSALKLGHQADPASHDPANSLFETPDLNQAHKWYQLAAQNGDEEGRAQLAALRLRVEKMAADGDPLAQRISLLWE